MAIGINLDDTETYSVVDTKKSSKNKTDASKIGEALEEIRGLYGKGAIQRLGDKPPEKLEVFPTGCPSLDKALGVGGFPRGKIVEIYGSESAGKSTLALQVVGAAQKHGAAAYIDTEFALDPDYAKNLGVDVDNLLVAQPTSAEESFEIIEKIIRTNEAAIIVVDSVAAMCSQTELNNDFGDANMGVMARLMSQAMRKLVGATAESNTCLVFINQVRSKIGVVFGSPNTTTGGRALAFYASMRLEISRTGQIKDGENVVGSETKVKVVKNKCAAPFKIANFEIMFGTGICREGDILNSAIEAGVVKKAGSWFSFGGERLGQGRENVRALLKAQPELCLEIEKETFQ